MRNHFVPQFYLERWCEPSDGRIPSFIREQDGTLRLKRLATTVTGHEHDLYALKNVDESDADLLEHEFFTPIVDTPASAALDRLIREGPEVLTDDERKAWARFLVAAHMRTPDFIRELRDGAPQDFIDELERRHNELRDPLPPGVPTIRDFANLHAPALIENIGMTLLPQLIADGQFGQEILQMDWWVVDFRATRFSLLTSDRPFWGSAPLAKQDCTLLLPLSPSKLFMASRIRMRLQHEHLEALAKFANLRQCVHAERTVYGRASLQFVRKHMRASRVMR